MAISRRIVAIPLYGPQEQRGGAILPRRTGPACQTIPVVAQILRRSDRSKPTAAAIAPDSKEDFCAGGAALGQSSPRGPQSRYGSFRTQPPPLYFSGTRRR